MNEILLVEPYKIWLDRYQHDQRIAIYSARSLSSWDHAGIERVTNVISYPKEVSRELDIEQIRAKLDWWVPIWHRWIGSVGDYPIYRLSCQLFVMSLAQSLIAIKVKFAVFPTSVSHHVEYSLVEIACQLASVKQIYLYGTPFAKNGRLLPLVQDQVIQDRKPLGVNVSNHDALADLRAFRSNALQGKPPVHNERADFKALSYHYAWLRIVRNSAVSSLKRMLQSMDGVHFIDERSDYSALSLLRLISKQKESLSFYEAHCVNDEYVEALIGREGALPILFAHYQPEATTFPEGGAYSNHLDIVIEMRRLGYRGTILYKEHAGSWIYCSRVTGASRVGLYRSLQYYRQLQALGCVFVKPRFRIKPQHALALFPITITGSIGVERSLQGLPTCCAGESWYKGAPGTYSIHEAFGQDGVFFNSQCWRFDSQIALSWFNQMMSRRTLNNYVGIATGVPSKSESDRSEFLSEFDQMIDALTRA